MAMNCKHCGPGSDLKVVETRATDGMIYRTRRCSKCSARYITYEAIIEDGFIPRDVRREGCVNRKASNLQ